MVESIPFPVSKIGLVWLGLQMVPMVLHLWKLVRKRSPERFFVFGGFFGFYGLFILFRGWELLAFGRPGVSWYLIPLGFIAWVFLYFPSIPYLLVARLGALRYAVKGGVR